MPRETGISISTEPVYVDVVDGVEIAALVISVAALLVGVFPVRSYLLERYWPYSVSFVQPSQAGLTPPEYRIQVTIRNRTDRTAYFGLGFDSLGAGPLMNIPAMNISRILTGETVTRGSFPVGPNERDGWLVYLRFESPLVRPYGIEFFTREPAITPEPEWHPRRRLYRYVLEPTGERARRFDT